MSSQFETANVGVHGRVLVFETVLERKIQILVSQMQRVVVQIGACDGVVATLARVLFAGRLRRSAFGGLVLLAPHAQPTAERVAFEHQQRLVQQQSALHVRSVRAGGAGREADGRLQVVGLTMSRIGRRTPVFGQQIREPGDEEQFYQMTIVCPGEQQVHRPVVNTTCVDQATRAQVPFVQQAGFGYDL